MNLTLSRLRAANVSRMQYIHLTATEPWTGADWSNAMCGEAGEAANIVKKIRRIDTGIHRPDSASREELIQKLAKEIADMYIYGDLLADHYDIDLESAVRYKFNKVSEREGTPERI